MQTPLLLGKKGKDIVTDYQGEFLSNFAEMIAIIPRVNGLMVGQRAMFPIGFGFIFANRSTRRIGRNLGWKRNDEMLVLQ